ncbi:MAG TPA: cell division protein ZapD [Burkholderiales bacterium]|nr:cell division protein ZapD [Burkholderiales bacterium]
MISYEYPLNERIRTLLRLEDLYRKVEYFSAKSEAMENHTALLFLFEMLEVTSRADLKSDLLQELEKQKQNLDALHGNPGVSERALDDILRNIDQATRQLRDMPGKIGQDMRDNEWLMSIKQRTIIPGGACEFDLPSYHYWLHQDAASRRQHLAQWLAPFVPIRDCITILLKLLRENGKSSTHIAYQGMFQQILTGKPAHLLRIRLQEYLHCIPEISANRYALNIRFTTQEGVQRPRACESDVEFELTFCNLQ